MDKRVGISGTIGIPYVLCNSLAKPSTRVALSGISGLPPLYAATTRKPGTKPGAVESLNSFGEDGNMRGSGSDNSQAEIGSARAHPAGQEKQTGLEIVCHGSLLVSFILSSRWSECQHLWSHVSGYFKAEDLALRDPQPLPVDVQGSVVKELPVRDRSGNTRYRCLFIFYVTSVQIAKGSRWRRLTTERPEPAIRRANNYTEGSA